MRKMCESPRLFSLLCLLVLLLFLPACGGEASSSAPSASESGSESISESASESESESESISESESESESESLPPPAEVVTDEMILQLTEEGYVFRRYKKGDVSYTVPEEYDGVPIVAIGEGAFTGYTEVESVTLPATVTAVKMRAFERCTGLKTLLFSGESALAEIGDSAFLGCAALESFPFASTPCLKSVGELAFSGCASLERIDVPRSLERIAYNSFFDCPGVYQITAAEDHPVYFVEGNCLIQRESNALVLGCSGSFLTPDSQVRSIEGWAFAGSALRYLYVPETVTYMGNSIWKGCNSLEELFLPFLGRERDDPSELGWLFDEEIPPSLEKITVTGPIGSSAFSGASGLKHVTLPEGLTFIPESCFVGCASLSYIDLPATVESIGGFAFSGCKKLEEIALEDLPALKSIGYSAFSGCASLTSVTVPDTVEKIGFKAFRNCTSLRELTLPFLGEADPAIFPYPKDFLSYMFGAQNEKDSAKYVPASLVKVTLTKGTTVGKWAFYDCKSLQEVVLPEGIKKIESNAFSGCSSLRTVNLPVGLTSIGDVAFSECEALQELCLPETVTSLGTMAFWKCTALSAFTFDGTEEQWSTVAKGSGWSDLSAITVQCTGKSEEE